MKKVALIASVTMSMLALGACGSAQFSGSGGKKKSPKAPASSEEPERPIESPTAPEVVEEDQVPLPELAKDEPLTDVPASCRSTVSTSGVQQASTGLTFRLLPQERSYDDGINACATQSRDGKLIFVGQELPDEVLACKNALGTLWLRTSAGANLWQPENAGTEDRDKAHWIICYYR